MSTLVLDEVGFSHRGATLLADISLQLEPHQRTFILGPNGAGKTLLLRLCHGLLPPTRGRMYWRGQRPRQAMVFQRPVMLRRSALANVAYALAIAGKPWRGREQRARAALTEFGLAALAERPARLLSAGEQQRLALARCWALEPELIFLDEPTASLDPASTAAIEDAIHRFHATGVQIVMSTHDLGQARRLADRVVFLHHGSLEEFTQAPQFFQQPQTTPGRQFVAGEIVL